MLIPVHTLNGLLITTQEIIYLVVPKALQLSSCKGSTLWASTNDDLIATPFDDEISLA